MKNNALDLIGWLRERLLTIGPGADLDADPNDPSPEDKTAHEAGLMIQMIDRFLAREE